MPRVFDVYDSDIYNTKVYMKNGFKNERYNRATASHSWYLERVPLRILVTVACGYNGRRGICPSI